MARSTARPVVKLKSTAGTGVTYVTRKNRLNDPDRSSCASTTRWRESTCRSARNAERTSRRAEESREVRRQS